MGAFKDMAIDIECLQNAISEILASPTPLDQEMVTEIAVFNGLNPAKTYLHVLYLTDGDWIGETYFPVEFLPDTLKRS